MRETGVETQLSRKDGVQTDHPHSVIELLTVTDVIEHLYQRFYCFPLIRFFYGSAESTSDPQKYYAAAKGIFNLDMALTLLISLVLPERRKSRYSRTSGAPADAPSDSSGGPASPLSGTRVLGCRELKKALTGRFVDR